MRREEDLRWLSPRRRRRDPHIQLKREKNVSKIKSAAKIEQLCQKAFNKLNNKTSGGSHFYFQSHNYDYPFYSGWNYGRLVFGAKVS